MPNYRIEALVYSKEKDLQEKLEQSVLTHLYNLDGSSVEVVAFEVFPNGSPRFEQVHGE